MDIPVCLNETFEKKNNPNSNQLMIHMKRLKKYIYIFNFLGFGLTRCHAQIAMAALVMINRLFFELEDNRLGKWRMSTACQRYLILEMKALGFWGGGRITSGIVLSRGGSTVRTPKRTWKQEYIYR